MPHMILVFALLIALLSGCGGSANPMRPSDPNLSQAHMERARFFWAQGQVNKTIQEMEWAINADPYNYEAAFNLGLIYLDQGQRISARRVWENALIFMEDGDGAQMEIYDNARRAAEIRAALAELDKADRQLDSAAVILARQQGQAMAEATVGGAPGNAPGGAAANTGDSSQPGLPQTAAPSTTPATSQASQTGGNQPKPYAPQDSKPRAQTSRSSGSGAKPDCPPCAPQSSGKYAIQVSSNKQQTSAQNDVNRLVSKGYHATIATNQLASGTWYVVWAGCCTSKEQAQKLAADLIKRGLIAGDARVAIPK